MIALACTLAIATGSCIDQDRPVAPRLKPPVPAVDLGLSDGCARFQVRFDAGGQPLIETVYNTNHCPTSELKLLSDTVGSFNAATGALRVPVVMENVGTVALIPRVRLRFNADSVIRYDSLNNVLGGASDIVAYLPDSTNENGRVAYWWYDQVLAPSGQPQVLMPGARTQRRWMELRGTTWAPKMRMKLLASGVQVTQVPAIPPDTFPANMFDPVNVVYDSLTTGGPILRNVMIIEFIDGATQMQRQALIDSLGGTVVGGIQSSATHGYYFVQVVSAQTIAALHQAVARARASVVVDGNAHVVLALRLPEDYLRPVDGQGWSGWNVQPTFNGSGNREALERLFSPLAWGCSTGGNGVKVAAVDVDFRSYSDIPFNAILSRGVGSVATAVEHGTRVASILAARGNDTLGMTGVLWSADLRLYERTVGGQANTATSVQRVMRAFRDGARVVNLSTSLAQAWGSAALPWHGGTKADSGWVLAFATAYDNAMRVLKQAGLDPLLVVSAGNFTNISERDAFWAGWGRLKQLHPDNVLVVAATATNATALHPVTGRGPRVSVAALGEDVYSRSSASAVGTPLSGTSFSAPQVAGIAGLLFHFDPRLTAMDVMSLIASGAQRGGRSAGGIPLANAYESLKLAAERQGAPLCGNRVWTSAGTIRVQRGNTIETIPTVLSPSDTIRNIEVSHGGKRIDYTTYSTSGVPFVARALTWSGGVWSTSSLPPLSPHSSGTWLSTHGTSHDRDTAFVSEYTSGGSPSDPNHRITIDRQRLLGGPPTSDPVQIVIPSTGYVLPTGHTEHLPTNSPFGITAAFPVTGDTGLLAVSMYHILYTDTPAALFLQTWPQEARLYRVLLNTSPPTVQLVSTVADSAVYFLGLSEDGREKVMAVGRDSTSDLPGPTTSRTMIRCSLRWSRPRFSATAGQRFDDSTAARWTVQNAQPWPAQNQIPEGCPVEERNGGTLGSDLFGGGTIAPRVLPQWLQQRIRVPRVRGS